MCDKTQTTEIFVTSEIFPVAINVRSHSNFVISFSQLFSDAYKGNTYNDYLTSNMTLSYFHNGIVFPINF